MRGATAGDRGACLRMMRCEKKEAEGAAGNGARKTEGRRVKKEEENMVFPDV